MKYEYERVDNGDGTYDTCNPLRDKLAIEIQDALPDIHFYLHCYSEKIEVLFDHHLSEDDRITLDTTIQTHKDNG